MPGVAVEGALAAAEVLDERVTAFHDRGGTVGLQPAHRSEPRLESPVVGFDPVVRVLARVVESDRQQLGNDADECVRLVGDDLDRSVVSGESPTEELLRGLEVTASRYQDVDDLAVLIDGPVHVPQVAPDGDHDHVGWEPEPGER